MKLVPLICGAVGVKAVWDFSVGGAVFVPGGGAEMITYDVNSHHVWVANGADRALEKIALSSALDLTLVQSFPTGGNGPTSIKYYNGKIYATVDASMKNETGKVIVIDAATGSVDKEVTVGYLPDMLVFTPDHKYLLVANEGEPMDADEAAGVEWFDPEGSVSIIDVKSMTVVKTLDFQAWNAGGTESLPATFHKGVPSSTNAEDIEPEWISVSSDSLMAYVSLQDNNAVVPIDLTNLEFGTMWALQYTDRSSVPFDPNEQDKAANLDTYPGIKSIPQPDTIEWFNQYGENYIITANEGDTKEYAYFTEQLEIGDAVLSSTFPSADKIADEGWSKLKMFSNEGGKDADGNYTEVFVPGGRSFSVYKADGTFVYDSGEFFEEKTAQLVPNLYNAKDAKSSKMDDRSDDKGPEPESLVIVDLAGEKFLIVALERTSGFFMFSLANVATPEYHNYYNARYNSIEGLKEDVPAAGPEGLYFVKADVSPMLNVPLLLTTNEISGAVVVYRLDRSEDKAAVDCKELLGEFGACDCPTEKQTRSIINLQQLKNGGQACAGTAEQSCTCTEEPTAQPSEASSTSEPTEASSTGPVDTSEPTEASSTGPVDTSEPTEASSTGPVDTSEPTAASSTGPGGTSEPTAQPTEASSTGPADTSQPSTKPANTAEPTTQPANHTGDNVTTSTNEPTTAPAPTPEEISEATTAGAFGFVVSLLVLLQ